MEKQQGPVTGAGGEQRWPDDSGQPPKLLGLESTLCL